MPLDKDTQADTEGHRKKLVARVEDDTEGHVARVARVAKVAKVSDEDDTEGHIAKGFAKTIAKGFAKVADDEDTEGHIAKIAR